MRALACVFLMSTSFCLGAQPVNVNDLADWDIVVAPDAIPSEVYAAQELQALLADSTGKKLAIAQTVTRPDRHIFVGPGEAMQRSSVGFSVGAMGPEDLRIVARDNNIAIAGGRPRGTLYGVYTFAEDYLGVRFLTTDHTCVPKHEKLTIAPVDRSYHPPLAFRWSYYGETNTNPPFATRLRTNTVSGDPKLGGKTGMQLINHTFGTQIPSAKYGKEHPEYFALVNGKRLAPVANDWSETQPCLSNPAVLRIVTDAVLKELNNNPKLQNISVSQNDDDKYCRCPACAAVDEREGSPMGSLLTFVNAVADEVAKTHPGVKVGTLSYWYTRKPPKNIRPRDNVMIQLCSIECCQLHPINDPACAKNQAFCQDVENWGKMCKNISIWNYNTNFSDYLLPLPNLPVIEPNVRYFVEHGAKGVFMQAAGNAMGAELSDLRNYLISNLLWDPTRSGDKLVDEFLDLHYGPAAPPIRRYIKLVRDHALASGLHPNCFGPAKAYALDDSIAQAGLDTLAEAMRLAERDPIAMWTEKALICARRLAIDPCWKFDEGAKLDPEVAARLRPQVKRFFDACRRHHVTQVSEGMSVADAEARMKKLFKVEPGQEF